IPSSEDDASEVASMTDSLTRSSRGLFRDNSVGQKGCSTRSVLAHGCSALVRASLRRELENLEWEAHAAKESASDEEARRKEVQLEADQLRGRISKLSQENEILKKEAGLIEQVTEATQAELRQMRASLRVARAAASDEKRRRENLEVSFDSHVAEAVTKALAVAASRQLETMPETEEEEQGDVAKRAKRGEDV
ncbi:unnamed protein product, partial [Ascophyllum nodosum]